MLVPSFALKNGMRRLPKWRGPAMLTRSWIRASAGLSATVSRHNVPKHASSACAERGSAEAVNTPTATAQTRAGEVFLYFTPLTVLVFLVLPNGFLLDIATSFMLKNQVRASAQEIANFRLLTAVPVYLSFLFGLARDLWNPFGLRDRGLFIIFGAITAAVFLMMTTLTLSYRGL